MDIRRFHPDTKVGMSRGLLTQSSWQILTLLLVVSMLLTTAGRSTIVHAATTNPIVLENQQPGSDQWRLNLAGFQEADDATGQIKGYASATSVNKGQLITFF